MAKQNVQSPVKFDVVPADEQKLYRVWRKVAKRVEAPLNEFAEFVKWAEAQGCGDGKKVEVAVKAKGQTYTAADLTVVDAAGRKHSLNVEWEGQKTTLMAVAKATNVPYPVLYARVKKGVALDVAVKTPVRAYKPRAKKIQESQAPAVATA